MFFKTATAAAVALVALTSGASAQWDPAYSSRDREIRAVAGTPSAAPVASASASRLATVVPRFANSAIATNDSPVSANRGDIFEGEGFNHRFVTTGNHDD